MTAAAKQKENNEDTRAVGEQTTIRLDPKVFRELKHVLVDRNLKIKAAINQAIAMWISGSTRVLADEELTAEENMYVGLLLDALRASQPHAKIVKSVLRDFADARKSAEHGTRKR